MIRRFEASAQKSQASARCSRSFSDDQPPELFQLVTEKSEFVGRSLPEDEPATALAGEHRQVPAKDAAGLLPVALAGEVGEAVRTQQRRSHRLRGKFTLGSVAVLAAVLAAPAYAADALNVRARVLPDEVHLSGTYHIQAPAGCPATQPPPSNAAASYAYLSPRCQHYVLQDVDLVLRVYLHGRLIFHDVILGLGGPEPSQGGTFDEPIFRYMVGNACGVFHWKVTLYDPYFRAGYDRSVTGSFKC